MSSTANSSKQETGRLAVNAAGRSFVLRRPADLESLWKGIGQGEFGDDERIPYWVELWPASYLLCDWLRERAEMIRGRRCLDVGCGLGLTAILAAGLGARVVAFDYELPAVEYARLNAAENGCGPESPLFVQTDWRAPGLARESFDFVWGGDILYERRFREPVIALFESALAPGGVVWLAEPERSVSNPVWEDLARRGFTVHKRTTRRTPVEGDSATEGYAVTVNLWELRRA